MKKRTQWLAVATLVVVLAVVVATGRATHDDQVLPGTDLARVADTGSAPVALTSPMPGMAQPAAPASTPTVPPAATPNPAATWSTLQVTANIPVAILAMAQSPDPEVRETIVHVTAHCLSQASAWDEEEQRRLIDVAIGSPAHHERLLGAARQARAALHRACDIKDLDAVIAQPAVRDAGRSAALSQSRKLRFDQRFELPAAYGQAATLVLSHPAQHPLGVDLWLEFSLKQVLTPSESFSRLEILSLHETLYRRLTGELPEAAFRSAARCAMHYSCDLHLDLSAAQRERVERVALALEERILQQQWAALGLP